MMSKKTRIFVLILATGIILSACSIRGIKAPETTIVTETSATGTIPAVTSTPTPTPSPTSTPTPGPTPKSTPTPTPTPSPTPESVYIPREELPEGQLFDKKYYAVLPGEGAMYYVYDCFGKILNSFRFSDGESHPPIGLFEKHEVEQLTYDSTAWQRIYEESENRVSFPGGYFEWPGWEAAPESGEIFRIVTDKGDTIIMKDEKAEWPSAEWNMITLPDATGICVYEIIYGSIDTTVQFQYVIISHDGTVLENIYLPEIPYTSIQIVSEKYVMIQNDYSNGFWNLFDLSGNIILDNTSPIQTSYIGWPYGIFYSKSDYFIWNGRTFDAELKLVPDETITSDGYLIPGVRYYVEGVLCQTEPRSDWFSLDRDTYATGSDGASTIAVKSVWGDCAIRDVDAKTVSVLDVSPTMVFLSDYSLYSLKTGEFIRNANIKGRSVDLNYIGYQLTDRYLIFSYKAPGWYPAQFYEQFYIFDEYGNLRYYSSKSQAGPARDDLILLKRGPYIGIADLNGDWVLKTVDPGVKRDAEELTYW